MKKILLAVAVLVVSASVSGAATPAQPSQQTTASQAASPQVSGQPPSALPAVGDMSKVGAVDFPTSCDPAVQAEFERGLALLHSFFYQEARRVFTEVASKDPGCAMAQWGIAMTYYHPLWTAPDSTELAAGLAAVEKARAISKVTERERGYIRAIEAYYKGLDTPPVAVAGMEGAVDAAAATPSCHGPARTDHLGRAACFSREIGKVSEQNPNDGEAAAFYALSLVATARPGDPTLANQKKAAAILEPRFAAKHDHPGYAHYLIHACDYPPTADKGLAAANTYAEIAPWVPHALHMPSHIYTRLGMWPETIKSNSASADASRKYAAAVHPGAAGFEELHALDYMEYGYLQTAQDAKAKQVLDRIGEIKKTEPASDFVVAYAVGAIPARYALERRQWKEAAALQPSGMPVWQQFPMAEGHIVYARAVGCARSGDLAGAQAAADRLQALSAGVKDPRYSYFRDQMGLQRQAALGLIAFARGDKEGALSMLRATAASEDSLGKSPVSPGAILPVRELYAETLLECGKPAEALAEFEKSLKIYPARFNGLYGAARAADKLGNADQARAYYVKILDQAKSPEVTRPEVDEARAYIARK